MNICSCDLRSRGGSAKSADISPQLSSVRLSGSHGRMAWSTWRSMKANSRHRLGCFLLVQAVSPGGKRACLRQNLVSQQRHEQLAIQPGGRTFLILLGQVTQLSDLLEAFENQFDLPAEAVPFQDQGRRELLLWKGRQHHNVLRVNERFGLQLRTTFAGFASQLFMGQCNGDLALADRTYPHRHRWPLLPWNQRIPRRNLAASLEWSEFLKQFKSCSRRSLQRDAVGVQSHREMAVALGNIMDAAGVTITPVGQNVLALGYGILAQRLGGSLALDGAQFEIIAPQRWPAEAVVNPPLRAGRTRLLDNGRIDQAQRVLCGHRRCEPTLLKQGTTQLIDPFPTLAQPFEQSNRGDLNQAGLLRPRYGFPHRKPASKVKHEHPQVILLALVVAKAFQSACRPSQLFPFGRKESREQFPILIGSVMHLHVHTISRGAGRSTNKLTLMGLRPELLWVTPLAYMRGMPCVIRFNCAGFRASSDVRSKESLIGSGQNVGNDKA